MPVSQQENNVYREFVSKIATELGVFDLKGQEIVWHYTNGDGFLGILQSSTLFATQVAALNDSKETESRARIRFPNKANVFRVCIRPRGGATGNRHWRRWDTQWTAAWIGSFRLNCLEIHADLLMEVQHGPREAQNRSLARVGLPSVESATHLEEV